MQNDRAAAGAPVRDRQTAVRKSRMPHHHVAPGEFEGLFAQSGRIIGLLQMDLPLLPPRRILGGDGVKAFEKAVRHIIAIIRDGMSASDAEECTACTCRIFQGDPDTKMQIARGRTKDGDVAVQRLPAALQKGDAGTPRHPAAAE